MFRGKGSLNRIELSRLVQDLLKFGVLGSLWLWGVGRWGWVVVGGCPPHMCTCMHAHTCTCTHAHAYMVNMIISCKWLFHWGNPWEFPMMSYACACVCVCMCVHVCGGAPSHPHPPTSTHIHPHPPTSTHPPIPRGTPESVKIQ